jgi:HAD superfamily hydrolase (TIGR01509 family)
VKRILFRPRVVLFDWDGTLLNSYAADTAAYLAMFRALEIEWKIEQLEKHYSPDWYKVYRAAGVPRVKWTHADQLWRTAYSAERPALLPGARTVVRSLARKFTLAIVTSGSRDRVRRQIDEFGFTNHFATLVCGEDTQRKKPHPAPLRLAMRQLRAKPVECVYVGDTAEDMEMARRARVIPIGVLGPFPTEVKIRAARPDLLLDSIRELPQYLHAENRQNARAR